MCAILALAAAPVAAQTQGDTAIIPGKSIGKVALGMSKDQLFAAAGQPAETIHISAGYLHEFKDVSALTSDSGTVVWIFTESPDYKTAEGLGVGSSEADIAAKLGKPAKNQEFMVPNDNIKMPLARALCFDPGVIFVRNYGPGVSKTIARVSMRSDGCAVLSENG